MQKSLVQIGWEVSRQFLKNYRSILYLALPNKVSDYKDAEKLLVRKKKSGFHSVVANEKHDMY